METGTPFCSSHPIPGASVIKQRSRRSQSRNRKEIKP
jgi:hypothetical protein